MYNGYTQKYTRIYKDIQRVYKEIQILPTTYTQVPPRTDDTDSSASGDLLSDKSRPSSLELLESHSPSPSHSPLASRSPSPERKSPLPPRNENENVEVSIPRLDSNAKALSVMIEGRPRSPRSPKVAEEGMFSRFPKGMIQV